MMAKGYIMLQIVDTHSDQKPLLKCFASGELRCWKP